MGPGLMQREPNKAKIRKPIHKAEGVTKTERYLNSLCEQSFLSMWSYPGVFRDQGRKEGKGHGKELCDMLVVFGEHIIVFSDKHCAYPDTGNTSLDWSRWFKKAIKRSAGQAWGAQRWLKMSPNKVYLDRACTQRFPLKIPSPRSAKYHLIVVAHGSEDRCKAHFGGATGSLILDSGITHAQDTSDPKSELFVVGDLNPSQTFVHVVTESTLSVLLQTLDTISDFVTYLEKKEKLFRSDMRIVAAGEEELLAHYLANLNDNKEHDFVFDSGVDLVWLDEGHWDNFLHSPQRKAQVEQNGISYLWDDLIERFSHYALSATQYYASSAKLSDTETGLRFLASEPRTLRRHYSEQLADLYSNTPDGVRRVKYFRSHTNDHTYYAFMALPKSQNSSYEEYRRTRGALLEATVRVLKHVFPDAQDLIGIAAAPIRNPLDTYRIGLGEDLIYLDARVWTREMDEDAALIREEYDIFKSVNTHRTHVQEYPESTVSNANSPYGKKVGRNEPCPCGSGRKYKRCHGSKT